MLIVGNSADSGVEGPTCNASLLLLTGRVSLFLECQEQLGANGALATEPRAVGSPRMLLTPIAIRRRRRQREVGNGKAYSVRVDKLGWPRP